MACAVLLERCDDLLTANGYSKEKNMKQHDAYNMAKCYVLLEKWDNDDVNSCCEDTKTEEKKLDLGSQSRIKLHECTCGSVFRNRLLLLRHITSHQEKVLQNDQVSRCPTCKQAVKREMRLRKDEPIINDKQCKKCGCKYASETQLMNHTCLESTVKPYRCNFCEASFLFTRDLRQHVSTLHKMPLTPHKCKRCKSMFLHADDLTFHYHICRKRRTRHKIRKTHYVSNKPEMISKKVLNKKFNAVDHTGKTEKSHKKMKAFMSCLKKPDKFGSKLILNKTKVVCSGELGSTEYVADQPDVNSLSSKKCQQSSRVTDRYKCLHCDASFGNLVYFKKHTEYHKNLKLIHIQDTEALDSWKRQLEENLNTIVDPKSESDSDIDVISCNIASNNHIFTEDKKFRCQGCNTKFQNKYDVCSHELCCKDCDASFVDKTHMVRHKNTHHANTQLNNHQGAQVFANSDNTDVTKDDINANAQQSPSLTGQPGESVHSQRQCTVLLQSLPEESLNSNNCSDFSKHVEESVSLNVKHAVTFDGELEESLITAVEHSDTSNEPLAEHLIPVVEYSNTINELMEERLTSNGLLKECSASSVQLQDNLISHVQHSVELGSVPLIDVNLGPTPVSLTRAEFTDSAGMMDDYLITADGPVHATQEVTKLTNFVITPGNYSKGNSESAGVSSCTVSNLQVGVDTEAVGEAPEVANVNDFTEILILPENQFEGLANATVEASLDDVCETGKSDDSPTNRINSGVGRDLSEKLYVVTLASPIQPEVEPSNITAECETRHYFKLIANSEEAICIDGTKCKIPSKPVSSINRIPLRCETCGQLYRYKCNFKRNRMSVRDLSRVRTSHQCGHRLDSKRERLIHKHHCFPRCITSDIIREKARLHRCNECKASFAKKYSLERHALIHTRRQHKCLDCNCAFSSEVYLNRHISCSHSKKRFMKTKQMRCLSLNPPEWQKYSFPDKSGSTTDVL